MRKRAVEGQWWSRSKTRRCDSVTPKKTTSGSRLDAREVVVVGVALKRRKQPPPARVWMRGRWWSWQGLRVSFFHGGTVSKSMGMGGWKIRTAKMSHDENRGSFFCDAPFAPGSYPPLSPRIFAHADRPTSLMRGEGHLAGGIPVVVGGDGVTQSRSV